eukprot:gene11662-biopygen346
MLHPRTPLDYKSIVPGTARACQPTPPCRSRTRTSPPCTSTRSATRPAPRSGAAGAARPRRRPRAAARGVVGGTGADGDGDGRSVGGDWVRDVPGGAGAAAAAAARGSAAAVGALPCLWRSTGGSGRRRGSLWAVAPAPPPVSFGGERARLRDPADGDPVGMPAAAWTSP